MNRIKGIVWFFCCLWMATGCRVDRQMVMNSPDGKTSVSVYVADGGEAFYDVSYEGREVLKGSRLGVVRKDADFSGPLRLGKISEVQTVSGSYRTPAGKKRENAYVMNERSVEWINAQNQRMEVCFCVSDNGVAFRYVFDNEEGCQIEVEKELTSFKFLPTATAWLHPHDNVKEGWAETYPSYEQTYAFAVPVGTRAPKEAGWSFPSLFCTQDSVWVLLAESGLEPPYAGTRLAQDCQEGEYFIRFPEKGETMRPDDPVTPVSNVSCSSPWRVILVGGLKQLVESTWVTDLAPSTELEDLDFVKPGVAAWSWAMEGDESMQYRRQKEYIDYAAEMHWRYVLVDALWDQAIGYEGMKELVEYAASRRVKVLVWYNSAGDWNTTFQTPKNVLIDPVSREAEFERISKMGIAGVKVDFFPGDGPSAIQYYYDMMRDAAKYKLLVNLHGATVPRGWNRTFPNLMTAEAVRGFEYISYQELADQTPAHATMLVLSRNVVAPMDYTPVCFGEIPGVKRVTTNGFEIALTVLFQSGIQHLAEAKEDMEKQPDFVKEYMRGIPESWEDLKFLAGYPGCYVALARKAGGKWYVAGINAEKHTKKLSLDLSDLGIAGSGFILSEGESDRDFSKKELVLTDHRLEVEMCPNGGFVAVFNL